MNPLIILLISACVAIPFVVIAAVVVTWMNEPYRHKATRQHRPKRPIEVDEPINRGRMRPGWKR